MLWTIIALLVVLWLLGFIGGVGGAFGIAKTFATSTQPNALALADLNKDGKPELLTTSLDSKQVSTLRGRGDGTFDAPASFAEGRRPPARF